MRRKDREVTDPQKIDIIIKKCRICRLGFQDNEKVYIVPLNFGFEVKKGKRYLYFHGANEGRKIDLIKKSSMVGFEMDAGYELMEHDTACGYSAEYQSVIGTGNICMVENMEEKKHALEQIMYANTEKRNWKFDPKVLDNVCVFSMEVMELSCKEHRA